MSSDIYYVDGNLSDYSDNADLSDDPDEPIAAGPAQAKVTVPVEDATFHTGVHVPGANHVTTFHFLLEHFGQYDILHHSCLKAFRNCSFISSRG
jgi:hypothetical protein